MEKELKNGRKNVLPKKIFGKEVVFPDWVRSILKKTKDPEIDNEKNEFNGIVGSLKEVAEMIMIIRNTRGAISTEDSSEIEGRMAQLSSQKSPKLVSIFLAEANNLFQRKEAGSAVYSTQEIHKSASGNLSPSHQKFLGIVGMARYDETKYFSIANDVIDTGTSLLLLRESERSKEPPTLENSYNIYKSYELIKEISYEEIINEPEFFVKQGSESTKMLEVLSLIRQTPELYRRFRKEVISPQDPLEISFKGLMARMSLAIQLDENEFYEVKNAYDQLHSQEQQIAFSELFVVLKNEPKSIKLLLRALENPHFLEDRSGNNNLLDKLIEILGLIEERNELTKELLTDVGKDTLNPWEYNEAVLRRLNSLLKDAIHLESKEKADELLKESGVFKKEIIAEGAFFRSNFSQIKDMKPEEIGDLLKNFEAQVVQGGCLIKSPWDMDNPDNYTCPNEFSIEDYKMLVENFEKAYKDRSPKLFEVLKIRLAKDLQNPSVEFLLLRNKKKLIGALREKRIDDDHFQLGMFYVDESFQKNFKIGQFMEGVMLKKEYNHVSVHVDPLNPNLERHMISGWNKVVGEVYETAIDKEENEIVAERQLVLERGE